MLPGAALRASIGPLTRAGATVDAAHGRLYARYRGRGTIAATDPDVTIIVAAATADDLQ